MPQDNTAAAPPAPPKPIERLDPAAFEAWLRAQPPGAYVGVQCSYRRCPAACWLAAAAGPAVHLTAARIEFPATGECASTPRWLAAFIKLIDALTLEAHPRVTREQAIAALAAARAEAGDG